MSSWVDAIADVVAANGGVVHPAPVTLTPGPYVAPRSSSWSVAIPTRYWAPADCDAAARAAGATSVRIVHSSPGETYVYTRGLDDHARAKLRRLIHDNTPVSLQVWVCDDVIGGTPIADNTPWQGSRGTKCPACSGSVCSEREAERVCELCGWRFTA